jgi:hypothetical protein
MASMHTASAKGKIHTSEHNFVSSGAGIHGSFTAEYLGPRSDEEGKAATYDISEGVVDEQGQPKYS